MIELTDQQQQELRQTGAGEVRIADRETGQQYVILRAEIYERLKGLLYDDSDWTPEEQLQLLAESGKRAGWDDPSHGCLRLPARRTRRRPHCPGRRDRPRFRAARGALRKNDPADDERLAQALQQAHEQAKAFVRRQMGLSG